MAFNTYSIYRPSCDIFRLNTHDNCKIFESRDKYFLGYLRR